jgi:hypothetical protein
MASVIIVGNSDGNLKYEVGPIIDTFDIVVRFHNHKISGFEKYVGTKTNYVFLSKSHIYLAEGCWGKRVLIFRKHRRLMSNRVRNFSTIEQLPTNNSVSTVWSSGPSVIKHFLDLGHEVTIHGICDGHNSHYWDTEFKVETFHDLNEDLKMINSWNVKRLV